MNFDYKKLLPSRKIRLKILRLLNFIPDKVMISFQYWIKLGRKANLKNPERFTEKLQWYKLNYRNPTMHRCVDKYLVREYVKEKGLEHILVKFLGKYNEVDEIDFNKLPSRFVLKTTNGGGGNNVILCFEKKNLNILDLKKKLKTEKNLNAGREWAYQGLNPQIIVEELLINEANPEAGIFDYKIFCYKGKPQYIILDIDRYTSHKRNFYDIEWNLLNVVSDCPNTDKYIQKPKHFKEMLKIASKLSEDFPFVRVDLYNIAGKIYFGELTFYPWSGYVQFQPDKFDFEFGKRFKLALYN